MTVHSINTLRNCMWDKLGRDKVKITILFDLTRKELLVSLKEVNTKMPPELTERHRPTGVLDLIHESAVVEGRIYGLPVFVFRGSKSVEGGLKDFTKEGRWQSPLHQRVLRAFFYNSFSFTNLILSFCIYEFKIV